jgi:polyhydroxyalkanoate synthesis regulator phasin
MSQTTRNAKHTILEVMERALDNNSEYIGETVWKALDDAYEQVDDEVTEMFEQLEVANERITELEERIQELEESA